MKKYYNQIIKKICSLKRIKLEIIIINDGSTDKSLNLITQFKKKKMKIISHKKNCGKRSCN